jgi:hypothetical protein
MLERGASTCDNAGATFSEIIWITSVPTSEEAGGSTSPVFCFWEFCNSWAIMDFMMSNSPLKVSISFCTFARALSPSLPFVPGPLDDDDRTRPDFPGVASSASTSSCVGGLSKSAACERSNCGDISNPLKMLRYKIAMKIGRICCITRYLTAGSHMLHYVTRLNRMFFQRLGEVTLLTMCGLYLY